MTTDDQLPIAETVQAEILSASIAGKDTVCLSIQVSGTFERPGSHVEIPIAVVVATIPAKVFPR